MVGYAQSGLQSGATMLTSQFVPVNGASTIALDGLTPVGDDVSDNVYVQTLNPFGYTIATYTWNDWMFDEACWVDDNMDKAAGVEFGIGQGLWTGGASTTQGLQTAGKVGTEDVSIQLQSGATAVGNPFPTSVALEDIVPEGDDVSDNVYIQTLNPFGYTIATYTWNDWMFDAPCWVDDNMDEAKGIVFGAGQGLWVGGSSSTQFIRFPAPTL